MCKMGILTCMMNKRPSPDPSARGRGRVCLSNTSSAN